MWCIIVAGGNMENKSFKFKFLLATIGTLILAVSINFIIGINWGMSTYDTACLTTQYLFGFENYGDAVLLTHMIFLVLLIIFMKKLKTSIKHIGISLISIVIVSRVLNFFGFIIDIEYTNTLVMLIVFLVNVFAVNLAIYLMASSTIIATPYDRFVIQLSSISGKDLGRARLIVDIITFIFAFIIILLFSLPVPISLATLFIVLFSGPIITMWGKLFKF